MAFVRMYDAITDTMPNMACVDVAELHLVLSLQKQATLAISIIARVGKDILVSYSPQPFDWPYGFTGEQVFEYCHLPLTLVAVFEHHFCLASPVHVVEKQLLSADWH